ncbi:hypothetical protein N7540_003918 [Penicillium herquei]|nr:hypothetical protein N7540_003918 [Penicillium herquei]
MHSKASGEIQSSASENLDDERASETPDKESPSNKSENNSVIGSTRTALTEPNSNENVPVTGFGDLRDLDPVLNASAYYAKLDMIELRTAEICGMAQGPLNLESATMNELEEFCGVCKNAFNYLQSEGLCGETISIMVEDKHHPDITNAIHVSLDDIDWRPNLSSRNFNPLSNWLETGSMLEGNPLGKYLASLGIHLPPLTVAKTMCAMSAIGLLSFSGSHVCRFDMNIWDQDVAEIPVGAGLSFRRRELACLKDFIGGPIWVLGKSGLRMEQAPLKISLLVQDLQELWGPVWLMGQSPDEGKVIRTERGYIIPIPPDQQCIQSPEIECHWTESLEELSQSSDPVLLNTTSRILIGTNLDSSVGLVFNRQCDPRSSVQRMQRHVANSNSMCGVRNPYSSRGDTEYQLGLSQYGVNANVTVVQRRYPGSSMKETIISEHITMPSDSTKSLDDDKFMGILNMQIGLEISVCTGNAQRVSLWDALRLYHAETGVQSDTQCSHNAGDLNCMQSCWTRLSGKILTRHNVRQILTDAILTLKHTGLNKQGNLEAFWPFVRAPTNYHIVSTKHNRWFGIVKDTPLAATFAVMSQRCLEFVDRRDCAELAHNHDIHSRQTCLLIQTLPQIEYSRKFRFLRSQRDPSMCSFGGVSVGGRFRVWDNSLTLKSKFEESKTAVLVHAYVSLSLPMGPAFRELVNPELEVEKPVLVVIRVDEPRVS